MKRGLWRLAIVVGSLGIGVAEGPSKNEEGRYQVVAVTAPAPATLMIDSVTGRVWVLERSVMTNELEFMERSVVGLTKSFSRQDVEDATRKDLIKKRTKLAAKLAAMITMGKGGATEMFKPEDWWKDMVIPAFNLNEFTQLIDEVNQRIGGVLTTPLDAGKLKDAAEKGLLCVLANGQLKTFMTPEEFEAWKQSGSK